MWGLRFVRTVVAGPLHPIAALTSAVDLLVGLTITARVTGAGAGATVAGLELAVGVRTGTGGVIRPARAGRTDVDVSGFAALAAWPPSIPTPPVPPATVLSVAWAPSPSAVICVDENPALTATAAAITSDPATVAAP
ncbi:hypothetical protein [Mycobacterium sp. SMC-14]|uniref:hypothetical protein n=1 Tax=Mycobacterium sp. SMC-14 TaxID=3385968 RepID=UPI00390C98B2